MWTTYLPLEEDRCGKCSSIYDISSKGGDENFEGGEGSGVFGRGQILFPAVIISYWNARYCSDINKVNIINAGHKVFHHIP